MNLDKILPTEWLEKLSLVDMGRLQEIRLRAYQPTMIMYDSKMVYLSLLGICSLEKNAIVPTTQQLEKILLNACQKSIYAYNEQIIKGYLTVFDGIRIGVAGKVTMDKSMVLSIKDICGLNIRIPHMVVDCSKSIIKHITKPLYNTLIVSPPGCGKTTFLRDIIRQLRNTKYNILVADERYEIASMDGGKSAYDLTNCDVLSGCDKNYAFNIGIRSLSPDIVVCDEISANDLPELNNVSNSGVTIFATMHANDVRQTIQKLGGAKIFDRYVLLSKRNGVGTIEGVYTDDFLRL